MRAEVLIYVGNRDWGCNFIGNERFVKTLEWTGHDAFNAAEDRAWMVDGQVAGKTRSAAGLTFATVDGYVLCRRIHIHANSSDRAGHMVPYDKPREASAMINAWLAGKPL